jgi:hypothetical protein
LSRWANDRHSRHDESEASYLRVLGPGDYRYPGADLGVLLTRPRMQTEDNQLTGRAHCWIDSIQQHFAGLPLAEAAAVPAGALAFKTA